eukprot:5790096-Karenia_brevis.AAC.1
MQLKQQLEKQQASMPVAWTCPRCDLPHNNPGITYCRKCHLKRVDFTPGNLPKQGDGSAQPTTP